MHLTLTTCSAEKRRDAGLLPAALRYRHPRIALAREHALQTGQPLVILSGRYGLLSSWTPIAWYDHALRMQEVDRLIPRVAAFLTVRGVTEVDTFLSPPEAPGWAPYHALLNAATVRAQVAVTPFMPSPPIRRA